MTNGTGRTAWPLRLGAALAGVAGSVLLAAAPAHAEPGEVDLGVSNDLATDNVPRTATLRVTRTDDGCVRVQTLLTVQMTGLQRDEIEIAVNENDVWIPLNTVQIADDSVASVPVVPAAPQLCEDERVQVRYRVTFFRDAPDGRVAFIGEAFSAAGNRLDRAAEIRQVLQGTGNNAPAPQNDSEDEAGEDENDAVAPEDTDEPSETPADDEETAEAGAAGPEEDEATEAPASGSQGRAAGTDLTSQEGQETFFNGLGPLIIVVGVGMTGIGGMLLVTIMRRSRPAGLPDEDDGFHRPRSTPRGFLSPTLRR